MNDMAARVEFDALVAASSDSFNTSSTLDKAARRVATSLPIGAKAPNRRWDARGVWPRVVGNCVADRRMRRVLGLPFHFGHFGYFGLI